MVSNKLWPASTLILNGLRQSVRLGCEADERQVPQFVRFDIRIRFESRPLGCVSDNLKDTICYAQLSDCIQKVCRLTEYRLIERLCWDTYVAVKEFLPAGTLLWIKVHKERPPIPYENQGTSFILGDWLESSE
jgi:dihydroneopterin aldolase